MESSEKQSVLFLLKTKLKPHRIYHRLEFLVVHVQAIDQSNRIFSLTIYVSLCLFSAFNILIIDCVITHIDKIESRYITGAT